METGKLRQRIQLVETRVCGSHTHRHAPQWGLSGGSGTETVTRRLWKPIGRSQGRWNPCFEILKN